LGRAGESGDKQGPAGSRAGRADVLLERGLELYGAGDLLGALAEWEKALATDPGHQRAREYHDYVRANFDALAAQFSAARDAATAAEQEGVPIPDARPSGSDEYASLDVELPDAAEAGELIDGLAELDAGLEQALEGSGGDGEGEALVIEAMAPDEDLPGMAPDLETGERPAIREPSDDEATIDVRVLPRRSLGGPPPDLELDDLPPRGTRPGIMTIQPRPGHDTLVTPPVAPPPPAFEDEVRPAAQSPELELEDLIEASRTMPTARPAPPRARSTPPGDVEDEATRAFDRRPTGQRKAVPPSLHPTPTPTGKQSIVVPPRRPPGGFTGESSSARRRPRRDDYAEPETTGDFEDSRQTREHDPFRDSGPTRPTPRPTAEGTPRGESVIVDERLAAARDPETTSDFRPRRAPATPAASSSRPTGTPIPATKPPVSREAREARDERVRNKVAELLKQAEDAAGVGDFLAAVTAVEAAAGNDEDGTVAPVLLHRHRDLLYRIYEGHIGDMHAVPLVAVPLHEIAGQTLDHRTGFLLSRIDGMLSFEDILDVAGMPRMEAYQILSTLLRKGVIEVRR
jgi:hypothetical protein